MANKPECIFRWDETPTKAYEPSRLIEEAVFDLVDYHNHKRNIASLTDSLDKWIDTTQESNGKNREIVEGDRLQVRVIGPEGVRKYSLGCYFEMGSGRVNLRTYPQDNLDSKLKKISEKQKRLGIEVPKTVGDYALLSKREQEKANLILLQIARFGGKCPPEEPEKPTRKIIGLTARFE